MHLFYCSEIVPEWFWSCFAFRPNSANSDSSPTPTALQRVTNSGLTEYDRQLLENYHNNFKAVPKKAIKLLGDERLFPRKAQQLLGTNKPIKEEEKIKLDKRIREEINENRRKLRLEKSKKIDEFLKKNPPTRDQLKVPDETKLIPRKALKLLGDNESSLLKANDKAIKLAAETKKRENRPKSAVGSNDSEQIPYIRQPRIVQLSQI